ncbi:MAG: BON domain-containing protein [Thiohalomonadaceae bacterium]
MDYFVRIWLRLAPGVFTAGEGTAVLMAVLGLAWLTAVAEPAAPIPPEALSRAVERELRADPVLQEADLYAISRAGEVTLGGTVDRLLWQRRAERVAETVRGVRAVVNRIAIRSPGHVPDHELAERVQRLLASSPALRSAMGVEAEVQTGEVHLRGQVASFAAKEWADDLVASVVGVRKVHNELTVAPGRNLADAALAEAVRRAFTFDALLADDRIEVSVSGGRVQLSGEVRSAAERRRARLRAVSAGAAEVDVSRLVVSHEQHWGPRTPLPDEAIARAVNEALAADPQLQAYTFAVSVNGGRVDLGGTLPTLLDRRIAARVVQQVRGVRQLRDGLTTRAEVTDMRALEARAREALRADPLVGDQPIAVKVKKQVAVLTGSAATPWQRQHAETVVAAVAGITDVRNELRSVQRAPYNGDKPYVGAPYFTVNDRRPAPGQAASTEDATLAEAVQAQLQWSAFLDATDVRVSVNRGVATLTGRVPTRFQAAMATQEAYEGGARLVKNLLSIGER